MENNLGSFLKWRCLYRQFWIHKRVWMKKNVNFAINSQFTIMTTPFEQKIEIRIELADCFVRPRQTCWWRGSTGLQSCWVGGYTYPLQTNTASNTSSVVSPSLRISEYLMFQCTLSAMWIGLTSRTSILVWITNLYTSLSAHGVGDI